MSADRWDKTHIDANHDLIAPPAIKIVNKPIKAKFVVSAAPPGPSRETIESLPKAWQPDAPQPKISDFAEKKEDCRTLSETPR